MRSSSGFVLVAILAACSSSPEAAGGYPDASVASDGGATLVRGLQLVSPTIDVDPRSEVTFCYYFHTSNTTEVSIGKWASHMTAGVQQMILFLTPTDQHTPGTLSTSLCGMLSSGVGPVWTYSADTADAQVALPADDGTGRPVGQTIRAAQPGFLQMHFVNPTDQVLHAHVELIGYAHADGVQVTAAAPFVTYNMNIDLPPAPSPAMPTSATATGTCDVAPGARFFLVSAHTFKQAIHTFVKDGTTTVFDNRSWANPGATLWNTTPFLSFTTGSLTYQCEYQNPNGYRIQTGDNAATDEMCVAIGYFFPAVDATGHFCLNSAMVY